MMFYSRFVVCFGFAGLFLLARCVYGLEESAVVDWSFDSCDLPAPLSHSSYDSLISRRECVVVGVPDVVECANKGAHISEVSTVSEMLPTTSYASIPRPRSYLLSFGGEGFIRSHDLTRATSSILSTSDGDVSNFDFFGGKRSGGPSTDTLNKLIDENKTSGGVLLVDFFANWCQPCMTMKTNLQVVENHYKSGKLVIYKIDVDENQELCTDYEISALPTLIFFSRGNIVRRVKGVVDISSLIQMIDEVLDQSS